MKKVETMQFPKMVDVAPVYVPLTAFNAHSADIGLIGLAVMVRLA